MTVVAATEIDVQPYPHTRVGIEARVPIAIELPAEVFAAVRARYERADSDDQDFADYLCDVVRFDPAYTLAGLDGWIDEHTGRLEADPAHESDNGGDTE